MGTGRAPALSRTARSRALRELPPDRKSTRLNSSHQIISYAVFCLKKKKPEHHDIEEKTSTHLIQFRHNCSAAHQRPLPISTRQLYQSDHRVAQYGSPVLRITQ